MTELSMELTMLLWAAVLYVAQIALAAVCLPDRYGNDIYSDNLNLKDKGLHASPLLVFGERNTFQGDLAVAHHQQHVL